MFFTLWKTGNIREALKLVQGEMNCNVWVWEHQKMPEKGNRKACAYSRSSRSQYAISQDASFKKTEDYSFMAW